MICLKQLVDTEAGCQGDITSDCSPWDSRLRRRTGGLRVTQWQRVRASGGQFAKAVPLGTVRTSPCGNLAAPPVEIGSLYSQPFRVGWNYGWLGQEGLHLEASEALRGSARSSETWPGSQSKPVWLTRGEEIAWRRSQVPQWISATQKKGLPRQLQWTSEKREPSWEHESPNSSPAPQPSLKIKS